jgi:septum site-determining protein MinC
MSENSPAVRIKGVGSSLWVTVAPGCEVDDIKSELTRQFQPLQLTADARIILDTGSGTGQEDRYRQLRAYLKETFHLSDISDPRDEEIIQHHRPPTRSYRNVIHQHRSDTLVLAGRVRSGQAVQSKKHLVIMGDVNPGCELIAGGDILVFGCLSGSAAAGQENNRDAIILALDFRPTQIKIGDIVAAGLPAAGQGVPEFAHVEENTIIVEEYLAANPFKRLPWPSIR